MNQNTTAKKKMQVEKIDTPNYHGGTVVETIYEGPRHREVIIMGRHAPGGVIRKISKTEFVDLRTGEVREFALNERKQRENLNETFNSLKALIRTNFDADGTWKQLFITLTYAENMQDHRRAYSDFDDWMLRLKRRYSTHQLEYIAVIEPQERGAWHYHVMLKSDKMLYIDNKTVMTPMWGHGATKVERLYSDDVGNYYVAYFTDLWDALDTPESKKEKKGSRLHFYPVGMKFYRCSRGIKRPEKVTTTYREAVGDDQGFKLVTSKSYQVLEESGNVVQTVTRQHFKKPNPDAPKPPSRRQVMFNNRRKKEREMGGEES